MEKWPVRLFVALFIVTLAGCAGRSAVPFPANPDTPNALASKSACDTGGRFPFHGPCAAFTFNSAGGTARLPSNHGYALSHVYPANTFSGSLQLSFGTAVLSQIGKNPAGSNFPPFKGFGTTLFYVVGFSPSATGDFDIKGPIKWIVSAASGSFPGTTCTLAGLQNRTWHDTPFKATPSGSRLVFAFPAAKYNPVSIEKGKTYFAFACK
jgi:hypothetical protein